MQDTMCETNSIFVTTAPLRTWSNSKSLEAKLVRYSAKSGRFRLCLMCGTAHARRRLVNAIAPFDHSTLPNLAMHCEIGTMLI